MKRAPKFQLGSLLILMALSFFAASSFAGTVTKVKDKKIVIEFEDAIELDKGVNVQIVDEGGRKKGVAKIEKSKSFSSGKVKCIAQLVSGSADPGDSVNLDSPSPQKSAKLKGWWVGIGYDLGGTFDIKFKSSANNSEIDINDSVPISGAGYFGLGYMSVKSNKFGWGWMAGGTGERKAPDVTNKPDGKAMPASHSINYLLYFSANYGFTWMDRFQFVELEYGVPVIRLTGLSEAVGQDVRGVSPGAGLAYGYAFSEHNILHLAFRVTSSASDSNTISTSSTTLSYRYLF